jgi:ribosomal protein L44E
MIGLWEWHYCEKCNTWTEHDSTTGGNVCRRCKFVSTAIVIDFKKQREQKLENEIVDVLTHISYIGGKYNYNDALSMDSKEYSKEYDSNLRPLAKAIISWIIKNK